MRVVPETYRRAMETQVDVDKVEPHPTTWKIRSLLSSETTHLALHQWTSETLHQVLAVPVRVPRQVHTEGPDLNNCEHAAQWGQDWNIGDADTSGNSDG